MSDGLFGLDSDGRTESGIYLKWPRKAQGIQSGKLTDSEAAAMCVSQSSVAMFCPPRSLSFRCRLIRSLVGFQ
jgi:hypothetical protein